MKITPEMLAQAIEALAALPPIEPRRVFLNAAQAADPKLLSAMRKRWPDAELYQMGELGAQPELIDDPR